MRNLIIDSPDLPLTVTGADNKVIGKAADCAGIQQDNINCLLVTGYFYGAARYLYRLQKLTPQKADTVIL